MIRTRFAPSPTGSLHLGNARVAVLNWLFARHHRGRFLLRIEDTDVERNVLASEDAICRDLAWLGLEWDEGPDCDGIAERGDAGPYRQSGRSGLYRAHGERLRAAGLAYSCYCTAAELQARREEAIRGGRSTRYDRRCLRLTDRERAAFADAGRKPALRLRVEHDGDLTVHDALRGAVRFPADEIGDFIIVRSDGEATYNFAVVVDDIAMRITHVIRGAGHLSNTPRQALLYGAFGAALPIFAHVPTVLGPDRQKLSKRHGAQALAEYRAAGYHPDAMVNYLSLLSWSSESGEEVLTRDRLVQEISLERIGTADVMFDPAKLRWLSAKHIERMPLDDLLAAVEPFTRTETTTPIPRDRLDVAVAGIRTHIETFRDAVTALAAYFPEAPMASGNWSAEERAMFEAARIALGNAEWNELALAQALRSLAEAANARGKTLYEPLRRALTGRTHGPPFVSLLLVQGRDRVLAAFDAALGRDRSELETT